MQFAYSIWEGRVDEPKVQSAVELVIECAAKAQAKPKAPVEKERCGRCAGTGQFITRIHNGQPEGPGGICFRCRGKGHLTVEDNKRNLNYDRYFLGRRVFG